MLITHLFAYVCLTVLSVVQIIWHQIGRSKDTEGGIRGLI